MKKIVFLLMILPGLFAISCRKDSFITGPDARLSTSDDSLHFDTLFTTTGSVTGFFKIFNNNNQKLRLSSVTLAGGSGSPFRINVDGAAGPEVDDIEMDAHDSIYVYVTVKIDPNSADLPFVVQDSIRIRYNGNEKWVPLDAWGQNAHFLRSVLIASNETWTNDKPYVILGGLLVDTNATLTIQKGCRIYVHADAPIIVDGTLNVTGEQYDSTRVIFRGDRLDDPYRDFPGGWPGIYFRGSSKDNQLQYAKILNAYQGIVADEPATDANPKVTLRECVVDNCYDAGILGVHSGIQAQNCLVSNCGKAIILAYGGTYNFIHCTGVAISNAYLTHQDPVLQVTDFIKQSDNTILTADMNAAFQNCIFWGENGTVDDEVVTSQQGKKVFNVNFDHCLWKVKNDPANITASGIIANESPLFDSVDAQRRYFDFHLQDGSPAIDQGSATSLGIDLDGNPRTVGGAPDLGCYEKQ